MPKIRKSNNNCLTRSSKYSDMPLLLNMVNNPRNINVNPLSKRTNSIESSNLYSENIQDDRNNILSKD